MYASTIASSFILGLLVQGTTATISYGKSSADEPVAWISGQSECQYTRIASAGTNPCEHPFTLSNGFTYILRGCGGPGLTLLNSDGGFNANCGRHDQQLSCGVRQEWEC